MLQTAERPHLGKNLPTTKVKVYSSQVRRGRARFIYRDSPQSDRCILVVGKGFLLIGPVELKGRRLDRSTVLNIYRYKAENY
jgi:hypothetical protein